MRKWQIVWGNFEINWMFTCFYAFGGAESAVFYPQFCDATLQIKSKQRKEMTLFPDISSTYSSKNVIFWGILSKISFQSAQ